ncbi:hypothetical protein HLH34_05455 [Gluconacetobacter azotocaptans]|uniref:Uncharacterized protein n=1 Tax=Gluconacetobacter azotocaptans TaxID=142834 RepID=A0A7W4JRH8_9PROT|nr:flagellar biosynthesis regulator FlaF [Gluconacetobacter azotocaptans]MBB2189410.1 hypothetical protein [Gluconacetobacter azotocaptans]GBQ34509.1 hypothetical protein AA13594_2883 [Gluconacetobacter azotocaptans DSM 13594]
MMTHPAMKAYRSVADTSLTGRQADAACFKMLANELETAAASADPTVRLKALSRHQRLWSMIMKVNALDAGLTPLDERKLFVTLANQAQRYAIKAMLEPDLPLTPLIEIAENVRSGLEAVVSDSEQEFNTDIHL